jgi:hypothetical protein
LVAGQFVQGHQLFSPLFKGQNFRFGKELLGSIKLLTDILVD